jgi:hypothetical protein
MGGVFNRGKFLVGRLALDSTGTVLNTVLVTTAFTFNADLDVLDDGTTSDPKSYEIGVSGYARQTLVSKLIFENDANDHAGLDADNVTYSALAAGATVGGQVTYWYSSSGGTTSDTGQALLVYHDFTATPTNGGDLTVAFADSSDGGVIKFGTTA